MSKRKLFAKLINVVNTTKQCSLKDMYKYGSQAICLDPSFKLMMKQMTLVYFLDTLYFQLRKVDRREQNYLHSDPCQGSK